MNPGLTQRVHEVIRALFPPEQQAEAEALLAEPLCPKFWIASAEKCCLAALKQSGGDVERLRRTVEDFCRTERRGDWRDMILGAGFGEDNTTYLAWADRVRAGGVRSAGGGAPAAGSDVP